MRAARASLAAVAFLTRLPVGRAVVLSGEDVARGAPLFPLVGAGIGAVGAGVALAASPTLSPLLAAALAVATMTALTGALHVDALADTLDATGASSRERALEIMRDSRIGSYGAAAIVLDLLIRSAAIEQLLVRGGVLQALVAAAALSRASSVVLSVLLPYPRVEGGPGSVLTGRVPAWGAGAAVVLALGVAIVALRGDAAGVAVGVAATAALLALVYRAWLGGATGDALGAATEVSEVVALVVAAALA
ncbi:MAG: adenosylcobinamide-GDP ribazoletransferase [Gaiellaceae bacterium]